ncbi:MAG: phosphoglycerate mutase, partial [Bacteroidetes bacterium]
MLMHRIVSGLLMLFFLVSCTSNYYFVRHAERANNTPDTPLSLEGQQRALALRDSLKDKGIDHIFATIYLRTQQTAIPLSEEIGIPLTIYHPDTTQQFVNRLKKIRKKDVLVVGHSNT